MEGLQDQGGAPWWKDQELGAGYRSFVGSARDLRWFWDWMTKQHDCGDGLGAGVPGFEPALPLTDRGASKSQLAPPSFHHATFKYGEELILRAFFGRI